MPVVFSVALLLSVAGQLLGFAVGSSVLVIRDALLAVSVLFCITRIVDVNVLVLASAALCLFCFATVADVVFRGTDVSTSLSAIRNAFSLVAIPVLASYRPFDFEVARWGGFCDRVLRLAFWLIALLLAAEVAAAAIFPQLYSLVDAFARVFLESKGVIANTDAGLFGLPRMRTAVLNPVQGAWLLLILWLCLRERTRRSLLALIGALAFTVAKVAGVAFVMWIFLRTRSLALRILFVASGVSMAFFVVAFGLVDLDEANAHLASGLLHLEGLVSGILYGLQHPLGAGFGSVGLAAARATGEVTPGMESFIGSTIAALGWSGLLLVGVSVALFFAGNFFSRTLGVIVMAGMLISDNVASLYLYAALLLRPYVMAPGAAPEGRDSRDDARSTRRIGVSQERRYAA